MTTINLFIFNLRNRITDYMTRPKYDYIDYIVEELGVMSFRGR